jgi:hypothetical protein
MTLEASPAEHSPFGASSRYRYRACPRSVRLIGTMPGEASGGAAADLGTYLHELSAQGLKFIFGLGPKPTFDETHEHYELIEPYVNAVALDLMPCKGAGHTFTVLVEERFHLDAVDPRAFGTVDCATVCFTCEHARVYDYKSGFVEVSAEENPQLLFYAVGALFSRDLRVRTVELVIVQPRSLDPVKRWHTDVVRIFDEASTIRDEIKATDAPDAPLIPGSHCRWCPASAVCPAQRDANYATAALEFAPAVSYDPKMLALALDSIERIEAWCREVNRFAHAEAEKGRVAPGYKLVAKRLGDRKWTDEAVVISTMQKHLATPAIFTDPKLKSPAQIEKLLPKDAREEIMAGLTKRESTGMTLVRASADERAAIDLRPEAEFTAVKEPDLV